MHKKVLLIFPILITLFLASYGTVYATQNLTVNRLAGNDRYETACQIAKAGWTQSDYAILAYGENYPDALAAVPLAKRLNAPILLTNNDSLKTKTLSVLQDLKVKTIYIVGGNGVITTNEENALTNAGYTVKRLSGQDRYDTAIKIAEELGDTNEVAVTTGDDYADALSIGPIAAEKQMPIILVPKDDITSSIQNYISSKTITKTYVVGGQEIISDNVVNKFNNPERITGQDKYARNIAVLNKFTDIYHHDKICLATGENFADALAGAVYAAENSGAVALVNSDLSNSTIEFLGKNIAPSSNITVFGGEGVVPTSLLQSISDSIDISNLGIEIIQGDKEYPINNQQAEININKNAFTIRFNLTKKAQFFHIAALLDENTFNQEIANISCDIIPYLSPGTGYAGYQDKPYDSMYISKNEHGQHYIYYENEKSRRADLLENKGDYYRLEWKINKITIIPNFNYRLEYDIKDVPLNSLYLVLFMDDNLNEIVDPGEFVKLKINLN